MFDASALIISTIILCVNHPLPGRNTQHPTEYIMWQDSTNGSAAASYLADPGSNLVVSSMLQHAWPIMNRGQSDLNSSIATMVRL